MWEDQKLLCLRVEIRVLRAFFPTSFLTGGGGEGACKSVRSPIRVSFTGLKKHVLGKGKLLMYCS